jgi:hypothetical protein
MMKEHDELFQLIKSLNQSEKRYFKIFTSRHVIGDQNNYIRLFEALDKQNVYDEEKLRSLFAGHTFIKHFAWEKNYLNRLILKSLRNYKSDSSNDTQLSELMQEAEILYEKSLFKQCKKVVAKAKKLAYTYERYTMLPRIIRLEARISDTKKIGDLLKEEAEVLDILKNANHYRSLSNILINDVEKTHEVRTGSERPLLSKIMKDPMLSDENKALSYEAKFFFNQTYALFYLLSGDSLNNYNYRKKLVKLAESYPWQIKSLPTNYVIALNNFATSQIKLKKYEDAAKTVLAIRESLNKIPEEKSKNIQVSVFVFSYVLESNIFLATGEFKKGTALISPIEEGLQKYKEKVSRKFEIVFFYNLAYLYFGTGEYNKSISWLNKILNHPDGELREEVQSYARIINLIAHYELGNTDHLEYILKSTHRFLYKKNRLDKLEAITLNYMRKLTRTTEKKLLPGLFQKFRSELALISKDNEDRMVEEFDLVSWADSKIADRNFSEIVKEKIKEKK